MSLTESAQIPLGTPAPDFALPGIDGKTHTLADYKDSQILVVVFMCNHCPYVQAIWNLLVALANEYMPKGVAFIGINSNDVVNFPEDSFENMKKYARDREQQFPYLQDTTQEVAKAYGATCTPDIFAYSSDRKLAYHGRFNNAAGLKRGGESTSNDLKDALNTLLQDKQPTPIQSPSMGCNIKWLTP